MRSNEQPQAVQPMPGTPCTTQGANLPATPAQPDKLIRIEKVCELTGLGKTSIYRIADFPKRVALNRRAVGWRLSEVVRWIESRAVVVG